MYDQHKKFPIIVNHRTYSGFYQYLGPIYIEADNIEEALNKAYDISRSEDEFRISYFYKTINISIGRDEYDINSIHSAFDRFQNEIINTGKVYINNRRLFKYNRTFPLKNEILELIPKVHFEKLKYLKIENEYEEAVKANLEASPFMAMNDLEYAIDVYKDSSDFIEFIFRSFNWQLTPSNATEKGFEWWFKQIFNRNFSYPYYSYKNGYYPVFQIDTILCKVLFIKAESLMEAYNIAEKDSNTSIDKRNMYLDEQCDLIYDFERRVDQKGAEYYFDNKYYINKRRCLTSAEVFDLIPVVYKKDFESLTIIDSFVDELNNYHDSFLFPESIDPLNHFVALSSMQHQNMASYVYASFPWMRSLNGFNWWYKRIFGIEFKFQHENEIILKNLQSLITNFDMNDAIFNLYQERYSENDEYSSKQAFYDAYGDGFSQKEDDDYWN